MQTSLSKRLEYNFQTMEFKLYNRKTKFASGHVHGITGKHRFFVNRESNSDIDIDNIKLENHCDSEEYQVVFKQSNFR